ncbi:MAG: calcium-binding protein [Trichodesmium sp. MAG_R01]|nr:calcium-binding protein [Trichodesmium sp. MAG_R01]
MVTATEEGIFIGTTVDLFRPLPNNTKGNTSEGSGGSFKLLTDEDDETIGSAGSDSIRGLKGRDSIDGRGGRDIIYGNEGSDTLLGRSGDDSLFGNQGKDSLLGNEDQDILWGGKDNDFLDGDDDQDTLYGNRGNDTLFGSLDDDCLYGGKGDDCLVGSEGNDTLAGDRDSDTLIGGIGKDLFIISKSTGGLSESEADIINDYNTDQRDRIGLIDGLRRSDLRYSDTIVGERNGTVIRLRNDPEDFLAIVIGVDEEDLDFITI